MRFVHSSEQVAATVRKFVRRLRQRGWTRGRSIAWPLQSNLRRS
jgi:hypothetical protein